MFHPFHPSGKLFDNFLPPPYIKEINVKIKEIWSRFLWRNIFLFEILIQFLYNAATWAALSCITFKHDLILLTIRKNIHYFVLSNQPCCSVINLRKQIEIILLRVILHFIFIYNIHIMLVYRHVLCDFYFYFFKWLTL